MKRLADIVDLSKSAQRLFFALVRNVDDYNKVIAKWKDLLAESEVNISKAKKELEDHQFIAKIGKSYVLNPFVVLSKYQTQAPENQGAVQAREWEVCCSGPPGRSACIVDLHRWSLRVRQ